MQCPEGIRQLIFRWKRREKDRMLAVLPRALHEHGLPAQEVKPGEDAVGKMEW